MSAKKLNRAKRANPRRRSSRLAPTTGSASYPLFEHMSKEHGLTLTETQLHDICEVADHMRMKQKGGVVWILINALHHLTADELRRLGEEIAKRSDAIYTPNDD